MAPSDSPASFSGRLGQTTRRSCLIAADDGTLQPVEVLASIDVKSDPALLDDIKRGDAYEFDHPSKPGTIELALAIALHDPVRRVFALLLPDSLRHETAERRAQLMAELAREHVTLPAYVAQPAVVFSVAQFQALDAAADEPKASDTSAELEASKEHARQRAALQSEREALEVERSQLDEVRERFDRERARMDEIETRLQADRDTLDAERDQLTRAKAAVTARELNLEQQQIAEAQGTNFKPNADEATQVVTDDQFIEIMGDNDSDADEVEGDGAGPEEPLESISDADIEESEYEDVRMTPLTEGVPKKFSDVVSGDRDRAVKISSDELLAVYKGPKARISELFTRQESPGFFIQYHNVDGYPIIAITLARLDDAEQTVESVAWPLDLADPSSQMILDHLQKRTAIRVGLYDEKNGSLLRAVNVEAPLEDNVAWIRQTATRALEESPKEGASFADAVASLLADDFELIGSMRHNFTADSFKEATSPSAIKLAIGIVEYWSTDKVFQHLVGNRSFPLHHFRAIQERIVRGAVEFGICLGPALRDVALEFELAEDEHALAERLIANFAETAVSLRSNDLDPIAQWQNWDALLALGEETGVPADNDVVELAESSLKRAREFEEMQQSGAPVSPADSTVVSDAPDAMLDEGLIVAKTSEHTGITYFLPDDMVIDTFEDLESMSQEDLELLLTDPSGRLEAAQMLLERFGTEATEKVMKAADEMNSPEVAALAKFLEGRAKGMEAELVRAVESGGPSAVYVATRGLATARSTTAIPAILEALDDVERRGDPRRLTAAVALYGDKLLPELRRVIKRDGADDKWVALLREVERHVGGTIDDFARDRSKSLREAAKAAKR